MGIKFLATNYTNLHELKAGVFSHGFFLATDYTNLHGLKGRGVLGTDLSYHELHELTRRNAEMFSCTFSRIDAG